MEETGYYYVKNWRRFQHYRYGNPSWIKLHKSILAEYSVMSLPKDRRWDLVSMWLLSSEMDGRLPIDCRYIAGRLGIYHVESARNLLEYFESKGLISKEDVRGDIEQSSIKSGHQSKSKSTEKEKEKSKKEKSVAKTATFVLPDWVPEENWKQYLEMRRRIKKPMTDYAMKLAVQELEKLHSQGQDVAAVINQSVMHSWQGLFAVGGKINGKQFNLNADIEGLVEEFDRKRAQKVKDS